MKESEEKLAKLLHGELSESEVSSFLEKVAESNELKSHFDELSDVHELLEGVHGESERWRMENGRRAELMAALEGSVEEGETVDEDEDGGDEELVEVEKEKEVIRVNWRAICSAAACVVGTVVVANVMFDARMGESGIVAKYDRSMSMPLSSKESVEVLKLKKEKKSPLEKSSIYTEDKLNMLDTDKLREDSFKLANRGRRVSDAVTGEDSIVMDFGRSEGFGDGSGDGFASYHKQDSYKDSNGRKGDQDGGGDAMSFARLNEGKKKYGYFYDERQEPSDRGLDVVDDKIALNDLKNAPSSPSSVVTPVLNGRGADFSVPVPDVSVRGESVDFGEGVFFENEAPEEKSMLSYEELAKREILRRKDNAKLSDDLFGRAKEAHTGKDYQKSVELYKQASGTLPGGGVMDGRRKDITDGLSNASLALGKELVREGGINKAQGVLEKVLQVNPYDEEVDKELANISDPMRTNPGAKGRHAAKVDKVRRAMYKGEGFYNLGDYENATKEFDKVLRLDSYNKGARRWQQKVHNERRDYYRSAYDETRSRLLTDVDKAWEIVPVPVAAGEKSEVAVDGGRARLLAEVDKAWEVVPVNPSHISKPGSGEAWEKALDSKTEKKKVENKNSKFSSRQLNAKKLQDIIIPQFNVENTTLETTINHLSKLLKENDPESDEGKKGVSFVIRRDTLAGAADDGEIKELQPKIVNIIKMQNVSALDVLREIEKQAGMKLSVEDYVVALAEQKPSPVTHEVKDLSMETLTSDQAFSTFSLHVSDVSFKLASVAMLEKSRLPDANKVRPEEFVNAFDYGDPSVSNGQKVACSMEQALHPFIPQRNLMRVSMSTAALGRSQPLRLTLLLDNSGSMERADREASVRKAIEVLSTQLQPQDEISLVSFSRQPRIVAEGLKANQMPLLLKLVEQIPSEGGTNMEKALKLAGQVAKRNSKKGMMSRVVLLTDGAANLGNADPEELSDMVVELRQQGIAFDACGVGAEKLDDKVLEALARKGDGRYYLLDRPEDADKGFVKQLAGALRPAASNVKVQVKFNPKRVKQYKLLGFEKHILKKEDFRDDSVDAAEMASQEAGSAMYQFKILEGEGASGDVGVVFVRFKDMNTGKMVERSWKIPYVSQPSRIVDAEPSMQLATTAAMLAEKIRGSDVGVVDFTRYGKILGSLNNAYASDERVQKLIRMVRFVSE